MQYLNDAHPWTEGIGGDFSMVDLISNETIPALSAGVLWWALERGASVLTAGGPSGAGKSTLANACLSFLPDRARAYAVAGRDDPLVVPTGAGPTYLLISELSSHGRPYYISGPPARRAFGLVRDGLRVVGTLHADSVAEAIEVLGDEVELSPEEIARVDLIAVTRVDGELVSSSDGRIRRVPPGVAVRRRIVEIGLLGPDPERGVGWAAVAAWSTATDELEIAEAPAGIAAIARWAGVSSAAAEAGIAERADVLAGLAAEGRRDQQAIDDAVRLLRTR